MIGGVFPSMFSRLLPLFVSFCPLVLEKLFGCVKVAIPIEMKSSQKGKKVHG